MFKGHSRTVFFNKLLGLNLFDVIGRRNGWQSMPFDGSVLTPLLTASDIVAPPDPSTTPGTMNQLAAKVVVTGGSPFGCVFVRRTQTELGQSTPVNSLYPEPVQIQVQDSSGDGIPNATVSVSGPTLLTPHMTLKTDSNGSGIVTLQANGCVSAKLG